MKLEMEKRVMASDDLVTPKYAAEDLLQMIHQRYRGDEYVVLHEVADGTGMYQRRWVDAAAFSLWPSKGLTRSAFEIKVSRSDLLRELQNPMKYQWARESFHEFWYVGPREIFQDGELPIGAGLMCPRGDKLTIRTHCQRNDSPKLDDNLLAAFMRGAAKGVDIAKAVITKDVLDHSPEYQQAREFEEAVHLFCESHGVRSRHVVSSISAIMAKLEEASGDEEVKQARRQLFDVAGRFQREVADLANLMAVIAHRGVVARDELGEFAVSHWGYNDDYSVEALKQAKYPREKKYADAIKTLLNWDNGAGSDGKSGE